MATKCNDSKRRDHKGRILKTGESQRADSIYQYRYTDIRGKRHCIYNSDLKALREEEKRIQVQLTMGIDYAGGSITVWELCKRYHSLKHAIEVRAKLDVEPVVDGISGFLFLNAWNDPQFNMHISKAVWTTIDRYNRKHEDQLPHATAHHLRHSFCTNLIDAGMNPKNVQYLMGHASITVTMNVYAHSNSDKAAQVFPKRLPHQCNRFFTTPLLHHYYTICP
ncbi:MAG: integrase DNA-binding domain-containing protein [Clostridia bacterium]|nr:integrase DNA-binding domain-containing protein [Clostridia bacterium]